MREIVVDTETTGLDPKSGDRLIEIGCVEIVNRFPTGVEFHRFIDPERDVPAEAVAIHGITREMLLGKPMFAEVASEFLAFIGESPLVIHNATFDVGFLNHELARLQLAPLKMDRVVDTLALARRKHPAGPNSLDALCRRYGIDNTKRTMHGAITDSLLLAQVYVELLGVRQAAFGLDSGGAAISNDEAAAVQGRGARRRPSPLPSRLDGEAVAAHRAFVDELGEKAIWRKRPTP